MPFAKINNIDLYYEVHGEGPALVLAHGAGGSHLSWWQQVPVLSRTFTCVTFDHRGFGCSRDLPDGPGPKAFVQDLAGLLDHLGIQKAALAGQSMGGWTVLGFASAYPERVSALILCDTTGGVDDPEVTKQHANLQDLSKGSLPQILARAYSARFPERDPARCFLYQQISALNTHVPATLVPTLLGVRHKIETIVQRKIPTLLLVGEEDVLTSPQIMEKIRHRIPQARLVKVPGAGHSVYFELPEVFNQIVLGFLREFVL